MPLADLTREAVLRAISEYEALGPDRFLKRYGYRPARSYLLVHEGRRYPSKAIAGVAHGYVSTGSTPLHAAEFSGGERTVASALEGLGFEVVVAPEAKLIGTPYEVGRTYSRRGDIHGKFGGQQQGGISTPNGLPFIFLFTGEMGEQYGYEDGWSEGAFMYVGEGQRGDMEFVRGNKAIRDHAINGKELLLFEALKRKGDYRYVGRFDCAGWHTRDALPPTTHCGRKLEHRKHLREPRDKHDNCVPSRVAEFVPCPKSQRRISAVQLNPNVASYRRKNVSVAAGSVTRPAACCTRAGRPVKRWVA